MKEERRKRMEALIARRQSITMEELCAHFGVAETDVIAVGDNLNDMAMIEAFYSYAMAQGNEQLKAAATHVTDNVTDLILRELEGTE